MKMPYTPTSIDRNLLLEFFLCFARFENALKTTEFFKRHPEPKDARFPSAEPDWDRYAVSLRGTFDSNRNGELSNASWYLLNSPPNRQVIVNAAVAWETQVRDPSVPEIDFLLRMARTVRNNLFHGGKHNNDVHELPERTEALLMNSMIILRECLRLSPRQQLAYDEALI
jgi:hypothetical protein